MNTRLADILLRSLDPKYGPVRERVRAAEKFVIEPDSIKLVGDQLVGTDPRFAQSLLRLPFRNTETRQGERGRAWLIEATDNSYVRANVIGFVNRPDIDPDRSIGMNPHVYAVDFGEITVSTELPIRYDSKIFGAGSGYLITDGVLFAALSTINFPHAIVEREDHTDYNNLPRQVRKPYRRRLEYHTVRVVVAPEIEVYRQVSGVSREYVARGDHAVRAHERTLRSGRVVKVRDHRRGVGPCRTIRRGYEVVARP